MKSILIIHQSSELYGSDKTILFFAKELDKSQYFPVVILPSEGPLKVEFEKIGIKVVIAPVLKLYRDILSPANMVKFFKEYKSGLSILEKLHKEHDFKLIYSHTLAVLLGLFFARRHKIKHLWHVQEIIAKPVFVNTIFKKLLSLKSNHKAIYDSIQTMKFWADGQKVLEAKSDFVWNGLDIDDKYNASAEEIKDIRREFFKVPDDQTVIGLIGRINGWKGQQLLLEAYNEIVGEFADIKLVFIGSAPPDQDYFVENLEQKVAEFKLQERVIIIPFQQNIWRFWDSIDIAIVPSTEPEPFGMVAIEAMSAKKPVIAANHGGLTEIVIPGETGFLFEPRNAADLAKYLRILIADTQLQSQMGDNGYQRVVDVFSMKQHTGKLERIFKELL